MLFVIYMLFVSLLAKQQHLVYWHICSSKYMISLIKIVPGSDFLTFQISDFLQSFAITTSEGLHNF